MNGKLDRRIFSWALLAGISLAAALPLTAEPGVRITGSIAPAWDLPPDLRAELVPLFPSRAAAERRLAGGRMEPLAAARPDAAGRFELVAPGPGFYRVVVRAAGWETRGFDLAPLLEAATLPPLPPSPRPKTTVARLAGPGGRPLAGVEVDLSADGEERLLPGRWMALHGSATTDAEGRIELPVHPERRALRLHRLDLLGTVTAVADAGPAVVPQRRTCLLEVRSPSGDPVPSALVSWRSGPVGLTGADGRIAVALPPAGEPPLLVEGPAGLSAEVPAKGGAADPLVVRLRPPVTVSGRVADAASGQPIPAAWVWAESLPFPSPVQTGPDGRFVLAVPPGWKGRLYAAAAGTLRDEGSPLAVRDAAPAGIDLRLRPAAVGSGQVVDPDGQGVPGALIRVITASDPAVSFRTEFRGPDTYSGADGGFRLPGLLPDGYYELSVTHEAFAPQRGFLRTSSPGRPAPPARLVLDRGQTVTGKVADEDGRPLSGARLVLSPLEARPGDRTHLTSRSAETGGFTLRPVRPGTFALHVSRPGRSPLVLENLVVPAGGTPFDLGVLRLERGATLEGRAVDPAGSPIQGAEVRCAWETPARRPDGSFSRSQPATESVFTDAAGEFRCDGLDPGGRFSVWAHHPLYADAHVRNLELPLGQPIQIELTPARTLSGRVTGSDGEPVPGAVLAWNPDEVEERRGWTDAEGRFAIPKLIPGVASLRIEAPTHRPRLLEGIRIPAAADPPPLEIVLDSGEVLEGRVTDSQGEPVADAWVRIERSWELSQEPRSIEPVTTGPDGRFRLGGLEEGSYRIEAGRKPWQTTVRTAVEVGPGTSRIDLSLGPEGEVSGRVRDQDGGPVPGASVQLTAVSSEARLNPGSAVTAADGSFRIPFVSPGRFQVEARRKGFAAAAAPPELEVAGEAVRNLEIRLTRTDQVIAGRLLGLEPADRTQVWVGASSQSPPKLDATGSLDGEEGYRITGVGPGEWQIFAVTATGRRVEGRVQVAPGAAETSFDLDFEEGLSLSGRVLVDRQPLAGAVIYVRNPRTGEATATTRSDGSFRLAGLKPGAYDLEVRTDPPTVRHRQSVTVEAGREVVIEIETGALSGQVTSAAGEPLNGATVALSQEGGGYFVRGASARTGTDGSFSLPQVSPGVYQVRIAKDGFEAAEAAVTVGAGAASVLNVALTPLP